MSPRQTVGEAVRLMREEGVGCILICESDEVQGIFTERDLLRRVLANGKPLTVPVAECMTPRPVVVHPKDSIAAAIRRRILRWALQESNLWPLAPEANALSS